MSLRRLRLAAGLTQARLAFLMGVNRRTVMRWEQGLAEPGASEVSKLAWVLRCPEIDVLEAFVGDKQAAS